jgi:CRP/FNR family transcriptional regulator, cyclic AMP receptor protein
MPLSHEERREHLGRAELFTGLSDGELDEVASVAGELDFAPNAVIVRQGQVETGFYLIVTGSVKVMRGGDPIATLRPGEFFGELTVLDQKPRIASVVAAEPTTCMAIASWDLLRLLESKPSIAIALLRALADRLRRLTTEHTH